jgi:Zn-dependent protease
MSAWPRRSGSRSRGCEGPPVRRIIGLERARGLGCARVTSPVTTQRGSVKLFELRGIEIFLHWSWMIVAVLVVMLRRGQYTSLGWNIAAYLSLFAIVLLHELGHALACRSVGGKADRIVLWPLGGVAYVQPPQRPGAVLWSIAAGPLVNLVLLVPTFLAWQLTQGHVSGDFNGYLKALCFINLALLVFNCLPFYPLDGGQMLRAVLWYFVGRATSLRWAATLGLVGAVVIGAIAAFFGEIILVVIAVFGGLRSWASRRYANALSVLMSAPVHTDAACPSCAESPPRGPFWRCACGAGLDVFQLPLCTACNRVTIAPTCPHCGDTSEIERWQRAV